MIKKVWIINGQESNLEFDTDKRLLDVLRDKIGLTGSKEGCSEGECGACSVILNGSLILACLTLAAFVADKSEILTVEGLAGTKLGSKLQNTFLEMNAVQCGFCTPGLLVASYALLKEIPNPTKEQIKTAISGNLCRCTGYDMIVKAIKQCSGDLAG